MHRSRWRLAVAGILMAAALCGSGLHASGIAAAGNVQVLAPVTAADGRLGLCDVLPGNPPGSSLTWAQLAYNAGARTNRWEIRWDRVEPKHGKWSFAADDPAVTSSISAGLDVLGILIGTPKWAAAKGQKPGNGLPRGLSLPASNPKNLWASYVRQTVQHYAGKVKYWEVWNEPDLTYFWSSTASAYYRLLHVAYHVIKQVDPAASVVTAGMVNPELGFFSRVLDLSRAAQRPPFDIVAWHAYGAASNLYTNVLNVRADLTRHRMRTVPIWVTEDGFPASDPNGEARQAAYVLQSVAYAYAAGAAKVFVYRASDDATSKEWGLQGRAGLPRMGYVAFQVAAQYLSDVTSIVYAPSGSLIRFVFYEPGTRIVLMWAKQIGDRSTQLIVGHPAVTEVDWQGAVSTVTPVGSSVRLVAPGAAYNASGVDKRSAIVGGPPVLISEDDTVPSGTTVQSVLPALSGASRRLTVVNPSDTPVNASVTAVGYSQDRIALQLAAYGVANVDLDLLAGTAYAGPFAVAADGPLDTASASANAAAQGTPPATSWIVPGSEPNVRVTNPTGTPAQATVAGYTAAGSAVPSRTVRVGPWQTVSLAPSGKQAAVTSEVVTTSAPLSLSGGAGPVTQPSPEWYVMHPGNQSMSLFDASGTGSSVKIRFVAAPTVKSEQIHLAPHQTFTISPNGATTVAIQADAPVAIGVHSPAAGLAATPVTASTLALAGQKPSLNLYNPGKTPAHVSMQVVSPTRTSSLSKTVLPSHTVQTGLSVTDSTAAAVHLSSDVPVVAAPVS